LIALLLLILLLFMAVMHIGGAAFEEAGVWSLALVVTFYALALRPCVARIMA
jgi:hypothetical protein